jgi:transcriptional regulator with XRE-family HTH domain
MTPKDLKKWRRENGYSQSQLAGILGVAVQTVSRWENAARDIPSFLPLALKCIPKRGGEQAETATGKRMKKRRR